MRNAIIHIGTEKTGSTAIQNFVYKNEKVLAQYGYYFPYRTCGLISNFRLVIYACEQADPLLLSMDRKPISDDPNAAYQVNPDAWRKNFTDYHLNQVKQIHETHDDSTVVYSSEHFHSRISHESEVKRLKEFLDLHYDNVSVIAYFRRQDRLAVSGHNTAIQAGNKNRFRFPEGPDKANYYDYLSLVERWSNVFGKENVNVRIFEKEQLIGGDVGKDFKANIFSSDTLAKLENENLVYEQSNPRLSHSALETLISFNGLPDDDPLLKGKSKAELRQPLIKVLHELKDDFGEVLPPKSEALNYYQHFSKSNQTLFDTWADGQTFNDNFDMYPEENTHVPEVNVRPLLEEYVSKATGSMYCSD